MMEQRRARRKALDSALRWALTMAVWLALEKGKWRAPEWATRSETKRTSIQLRRAMIMILCKSIYLSIYLSSIYLSIYLSIPICSNFFYFDVVMNAAADLFL